VRPLRSVARAPRCSPAWHGEPEQQRIRGS
jgi:hypothetical protein